ncbi:MAG: hypothetical protein JSV24_03945 [Bacteroidales bacterium]|nr:MAG: hypothetical protein JSV24_03945 [Bacteroidales bacterium]
MKRKKSSMKSKRKDKNSSFREKKIKDPRKDKPDKDFSIYDELEEIDPQELLDEFEKFKKEDEDEDLY